MLAKPSRRNDLLSSVWGEKKFRQMIIGMFFCSYKWQMPSSCVLIMGSVSHVIICRSWKHQWEFRNAIHEKIHALGCSNWAWSEITFRSRFCFMHDHKTNKKIALNNFNYIIRRWKRMTLVLTHAMLPFHHSKLYNSMPLFAHSVRFDSSEWKEQKTINTTTRKEFFEWIEREKRLNGYCTLWLIK